MARMCFALIYDAIKVLMSFGMDHPTRSPLVQTEGRRRHFGGSPNSATPNPCLTQPDLGRTIQVFTALWPCPGMVQVDVSHFPLPHEVLIQLYSTFQILFIATDLGMIGNVGSSTPGAAPKHRGEDPRSLLMDKSIKTQHCDCDFLGCNT